MALKKQIAIYGKAGIGKSITSSNLSAALSATGEKVMQVGCDPKRDSIYLLCGGKMKPTIMEHTAKNPRMTEKLLDEVIYKGFNGVVCTESGGPLPGRGCAGKGVNMALGFLQQFKVFERYGISVAVFDVLGDVVCGGFSQPIRSGYAKEMYIVICGEVLTLFQSNNITKAVIRLHEMGVEVGMGGLINNMRGVPHEKEIVEEFGQLIGVPVMEHIPRAKVVQEAEFQGKTVIEAFPDSEQAQVYKSLAKKVLNNNKTYIPRVADMAAIQKITSKYSE